MESDELMRTSTVEKLRNLGLALLALGILISFFWLFFETAFQEMDTYIEEQLLLQQSFEERKASENGLFYEDLSAADETGR